MPKLMLYLAVSFLCCLFLKCPFLRTSKAAMCLLAVLSVSLQHCMLFVLLKIINLFFKTTYFKLQSSEESLRLPCLGLYGEKKCQKLEKELSFLASLRVLICYKAKNKFVLSKRKMTVKCLFPFFIFFSLYCCFCIRSQYVTANVRVSR